MAMFRLLLPVRSLLPVRDLESSGTPEHLLASIANSRSPNTYRSIKNESETKPFAQTLRTVGLLANTCSGSTKNGLKQSVYKQTNSISLESVHGISLESIHGCTRNNAAVPFGRSTLLTFMVGMSAVSFLHSSLLQPVSAVMLLPVLARNVTVLKPLRHVADQQ